MIRTLTARAADADLVIAEGSMGLFDGVAKAGEHGTGASADIATLMGWPVVLVLDVSGQAQSAAAVALGFAAMRPNLRLAGVILNRVASARHERLARLGMEAAGITVLGALPRRGDLTLPERSPCRQTFCLAGAAMPAASISSLRSTRTSSPSSPKYCTRLKVKES